MQPIPAIHSQEQITTSNFNTTHQEQIPIVTLFPKKNPMQSGKAYHQILQKLPDDHDHAHAHLNIT